MQIDNILIFFGICSVGIFFNILYKYSTGEMAFSTLYRILAPIIASISLCFMTTISLKYRRRDIKRLEAKAKKQ